MRILFTSFFNQLVPAAERWAQREVEIAELLAHAGAAGALAATVGTAAAGALRGQLPADAPAWQPLVRSMPRYDEPSFIWRLVSSNHREQARGIGMFDSYQEAAAHAAQVQAEAAALSIVPLHRPVDGLYGWVAVASGRALLSCSQWYPLAAERDRAAVAALERLPQARIAEKPAKHGQRHRLAAPDISIMVEADARVEG
ncbi:hypothetical protein LVY72_00345 [Arthrobacter sp. I2-34]|uniref:Chlorite dismutase n=1 Tax=Arthrobacter hankyongi TaxID=2904801 RepID=A0ABS9L1A8_9MICC|nr:hypothetical protein [Arthrobacter hankyongi]MCG2620358.1 hypothetical protein [Arthrobacter hankyongi]